MICSVYDRYILMECKQPEHKHLTNKKRPVAMGDNLYSLDMPKSSTEDLYKGSETSQGTGAAAASTVYDGGEAVHENGGYVASEEEDAVVTANHKNTDLEGRLDNSIPSMVRTKNKIRVIPSYRKRGQLQL